MKNGLIIARDGTKEWYQNGLLHRTDGPAVEGTNGFKLWYQNNKLHRTDGPALEYPGGSRAWYQNGNRHRIDGPAVVYSSRDYKEWWLNDKKYTEIDYYKELYRRKIISEIDCIFSITKAVF